MTQNGAILAIRETSALAMWSAEQIQVIKDLICPGANNTELELFGQVCRRTGLDPFSRQIYGLMRYDKRAKREKLSIQTSIDGFRLTAERTGKYAGQLGPQWCGPDGAWRDVWLDAGYPAAARVGVLRSDWHEPMWSVARWDSYVQKFKNRENGGEFVGEMWQRMPDVMIAKCAESLGLRRAFPAELSGLYTAEEMAQAGNQDGPHIEDLPQFQNAVVIESVSAVIRPEPEPEFHRGPVIDLLASMEPAPAAPERPRPAVSPNKPEPTSKENARALDMVGSRPTLIATLAQRIRSARDLGGEFSMPKAAQLQTLTDADIARQIADLDAAIAAASQSQTA